ncbi:hypothetical protein F9C07_2066794, partial [Aspergillus flavus]
QKNRSILYISIISRPNIAKACQILSKSLLNPISRYIAATNHMILYLYGTQYLSIEFSGPSPNSIDPDQSNLARAPSPSPNPSPIFSMASDAAFTDHSDKKSSEGYICKLYSGPINWLARKQKTVALSTTKTKLLALTSASRQFL